MWIDKSHLNAFKNINRKFKRKNKNKIKPFKCFKNKQKDKKMKLISYQNYNNPLLN